MRKAKSRPNMKLQERKTICIALALSVVLAVFTATVVLAADDYPSKPIRFIIPVSPGGSNDIAGRFLATKLSEGLGKQVVVENKAGAGGLLGTEFVANAAPDGYTILIISPAHAFCAALYKLTFDPVKSFVPVVKLAWGPMVAVVHPSVPAKSIAELIALLKKEPGKMIVSCAGPGSGQHLTGTLFRLMTGTDFKVMQFKGGGPALTDLLGGHSQLQFASLMQSFPHIRSGKLRLLGTSGLKRFVATPDVPTIAETVPGYESTQWWGIVAPKGTPAPVVERLQKEFKKILTSEDVKKSFLDMGAEVDYQESAEWGQYIESEVIKWGKVVRDANIKLEE